MLIAQITDPHLRAPGQKAYRVVETDRYLPPAIEALNALEPRPDIVLITGDLTDFGRPAEYAHLRDQLKALKLPWVMVPGNHDRREALRAAFPDHDYLGTEGFMHYSLEHLPLRLIGLDTLVEGESGGALCRERLDWLEARLAERPERPTVIFMHHPPFATGIGHMDSQGLAGAAELETLVRRYPCVERLLCGHIHRPIVRRFGGTIASVCPGVAHQVALDLRFEAPGTFCLEPPGYQLHLWEAGALISHGVTLGDYPGPFLFRENGTLIDD